MNMVHRVVAHRSSKQSGDFRRRDPTKWMMGLLVTAFVFAGLMAINRFL
jgi:hypothetical protein